MKALSFAFAVGVFVVACGSTPEPTAPGTPPVAPTPADASPPDAATAGASAPNAASLPAPDPAANGGASPAAGAGPAQGCSKALTPAAAPPKEGQECGGATNVKCADELSCVLTYRCPRSVGVCRKK